MEAFSRHGVGGLVSGLAGNSSIEETNRTTPLSIRSRQRAALETMLKAGRSEDDDDIGGDEWKVLVYDDVGRDIIAPLLRVADLRRLGVTLHLSLNNPRQPIPDVGGVYFIAPTRDNIRRVCQDISNGLYDSFSLHFTGRLSRELLELLAENVAKFSNRVTRVFDMYTEFSALENDLFALNVANVYNALNSKNATNSSVELIIDRVVDGLFCAIATLGVVPFIRAQRSGAAEMVATKLDAKLRENLISRNNLFVDTNYHASRPLLILIDRTLDVPVMLHHTWTYQALTHDTLGLKLNRVKIGVKDDATLGLTTRERAFDLDKNDDEFWCKNAGLPFPLVAEAVENALQNYKSEVAKLNADGVGPNSIPDEAKDAETAKKLAAAIQNLPELRKRKQMIDLHTNIATGLLDQIKERGLDGYFQVEEELLMRPTNFNVERVIALIQGHRGTPDDKLRLFLVYFLCMEAPSNSWLDKCVNALRSAGVDDFRAYEFVKSIKAFTQNMAAIPPSPKQPATALGAVGAVGTTVLGTLSQVADGVNRLIVSEDKALAAARVCNTLMDARGDQNVLDKYLFLDPKSNTPPPIRAFKDAILFVVGPGNYVEYQNCRDHVCATADAAGKKFVPNGKSLIYGATELAAGNQFLACLHDLAGPKPKSEHNQSGVA